VLAAQPSFALGIAAVLTGAAVVLATWGSVGRALAAGLPFVVGVILMAIDLTRALT
jgi:hypothetical protein